MKKVIVCCERSQRVCEAFLDKGCDAYSCDIVATSGNYPERHIISDVRNINLYDYDLVIAHPPCTYLSNVQACRMYKNGELDLNRYKKALEAKELFMYFYNLEGISVCIENPKPWPGIKLPKQDDIIEPYYFGERYSKKTYLWLKNLPPLFPTELVIPDKKFMDLDKSLREITFNGIAKAMAFYWS